MTNMRYGHQVLLRPMRHLSQLVLMDWSRPMWEPLCTWAGAYTMCVCWVYSSFLVRWKTLEGINGFPEATKRMTEHCLCWIHWSFLSTDKKVVLKSFDEQGLIGPCAKFQLFQSWPSCFSTISTTFLRNIWRKYFPLDLWAVFTCPKQLWMVSLKIEQNLGLSFF